MLRVLQYLCPITTLTVFAHVRTVLSLIRCLFPFNSLCYTYFMLIHSLRKRHMIVTTFEWLTDSGLECDPFVAAYLKNQENEAVGFMKVAVELSGLLLSSLGILRSHPSHWSALYLPLVECTNGVTRLLIEIHGDTINYLGEVHSENCNSLPLNFSEDKLAVSSIVFFV